MASPAPRSTTVELLVVGFGCAGACAAMQAIETMEKDKIPRDPAVTGPRVLVVDRFEGGGATSRSGGIIYCGGGTDVQKHLGVQDTPANMFRYLQAEVGGSVSDETLWRFCFASAPTAAWLRDSFNLHINRADETAVLCPFKTSNAPDKYSLFYSGSETAAPFNRAAHPAPRGHKAVGPGNLVGTGNVLFEALERAVRALEPRGCSVYTQTKVTELLLEGERVVGARLLSLRHAPSWVQAMHYRIALYGGLTNPVNVLDGHVQSTLAAIEKRWGAEELVLATRGVMLASGGFCRNYEQIKKHVPTHAGAMPIGSAGDQGDGIFELGIKQAGAGAKHLDKASLWKFIVPSASMAKAIAVDPVGRRMVNEDVYGARLAENIEKKGKGRGYLIIDQKVWDACHKEVLGAGEEMLLFQKAFTMLHLLWNRQKAATVPELARKCGMDPAVLQATVDEYNVNAAQGVDAVYGKSAHLLTQIAQGPFYAVDLSFEGTLFPSPFLTLGGLDVDDKTGQVRHKSGRAIPGLLAAGRVASGVCSTSYVSGLSLADCVFAGRRAAEFAVGGREFAQEADSSFKAALAAHTQPGQAAAAAATKQTPKQPEPTERKSKHRLLPPALSSARI
jgi:3-oxo-5alpha-steroid 4-dehydrogenase